MGGWDTGGVQVETEIVDTKEYRNEWQLEVGLGVSWVLTPQYRAVKQTRSEWRGLTQDAAEGMTATTGFDIIDRARVGDSGQWKVIEEKIENGAWTDV
jgi:hypothetical protein